LSRFFYFDASALAKRYVPEPGTQVINHLFSKRTPSEFLVLNIGMAEIVSLLVRKRNAGKLSPSGFLQCLADLRVEIISQPAFRKLEVAPALINASLPIIIQHSINATDAILLRSAVDFATSLRVNGDDLVLVASDQRLLRAAQAEGLIVFNPEPRTTTDLDFLLA
jgi:uncharacterized protein